ncbi:hypothetical protein L227DRAFT_404327 [Lentinus tigrinus ALCF2SS1-6]|uniref:Uncharacterized protein n=1 Tax=Lentinus tigrinus ALCF2SS1-6 TaxID=1328759 RepID=A0A5C2RNM0_9APHY|nr:hypothetical protein L227DRAFT_404327 [Lentinus tigrinus ALCF2SS1-6]
MYDTSRVSSSEPRWPTRTMERSGSQYEFYMASTLISVTDIDYISGSHASTGQRASCQCSSTVTAQAQALDCYQPLDPTKLTPDDHITFGPRRSSDDEIFIVNRRLDGSPIVFFQVFTTTGGLGWLEQQASQRVPLLLPTPSSPAPRRRDSLPSHPFK